jgi:fluoroquinolone transport system permease protein
MSRFSATLRLDVRLQGRSGLYAIGVSVAIIFGLLARFFIDEQHAGRVLPAFYLLGVGSTTYIFGASLVLMEKSQGTLAALRASPLTSDSYIGSKILTLTSFALLESVIVYGAGFGGIELNFLPMGLGVASLGVLYTLIGMGQVAAHGSVTSFLMPGALLVGSFLQLPVFYLLGVGPPAIWYVIPTQGPLLLTLASFEPLKPWQWAYALLMSLSAVVVAWWWARRRFSRFMGLSEG